jgi:hypothetical protein
MILDERDLEAASVMLPINCHRKGRGLRGLWVGQDECLPARHLVCGAWRALGEKS